MSQDKEKGRKMEPYTTRQSEDGQQIIIIPSLLKRKDLGNEERRKFETEEEEKEDCVLGDREFMTGQLAEKKSCSEEECDTIDMVDNDSKMNREKEVATRVCEICEKVLKTAKTLKNHMSIFHTAASEAADRFKCRLCDTYFKDFNSLNVHVYNTHAPERSKCEHCDLRFEHRYNMMAHVKKVHPKSNSEVRTPSIGQDRQRPHSTVEGPQEVAEGGDRPLSLDGDGTTTVRCHSESKPGPERATSDVVEVKELKRADASLKSKNCHLCTKTYRSYSALYHHKARVHGPDQQLPCTSCGKSFRNRYHLYCHKRDAHVEGQLQCSQCDYKTHMKSYLTRHDKITHKHIKDFVCQFCAKKYSWNVNLKYHIRAHHEGAIRRDSSGKRIFPCELCGQVCGSKNWLTAHKNGKHGDVKDTKETGSNIFKCQTCVKKYTTKNGLIKHMIKSHRLDTRQNKGDRTGGGRPLGGSKKAKIKLD